MGVNCQATTWQLTTISNCCCVQDLGGFCCVLLGQNRPSNTQHALSFFHENNSGSNNKKNIFPVVPATSPPQGSLFSLVVVVVVVVVGGVRKWKTPANTGAAGQQRHGNSRHDTMMTCLCCQRHLLQILSYNCNDNNGTDTTSDTSNGANL
eukprot:15361535-Ditylum_brightwellii.AAC.1